ncbi:MAG: rRNA pseudouridine synthase [Lachnospiraceae bacterium]|nr:rRNA pseudouridine synthase [Lachnospiraceae bacterium]
MRLNKYIASCGVCSRREADQLIIDEQVTVNGQIATFAMDVTDADTVLVKGRPIRIKKKRVYAFYKPIGVTCSKKDEHAERVISDVVMFPEHVTYAGRLDRDSEGLMIMTNDGDLIDQMMRSSAGHEKEYVVRVHQEITPDFLNTLRGGMHLTKLDVDTRPCKVEQKDEKCFHIILTQGFNRQIRRMCGQLGYQVTNIKRIRVVNIELGELRPGEWREVTGDELHELYRRVRKNPKPRRFFK